MSNSTQYVVKPEDTLSKIAQMHNLSLNELLRLNPQINNPALIHVNDVIQLPFKVPVASSNSSIQSANKIIGLSKPMELNYSDRFGKKAVFTFDDGPHPVYTQKILDLLKKLGLKTTFFVLGQNVKKYPELIRKIVTQGHVLGNHTYDHPALTTLSNEEIKDQLRRTQKAVDEALGYSYPLRQFRPPYGDVNERVIKAAAEVGATQVILWNADSEDWKHGGSNTIIDKVMREAGSDGGAILFHDIHPEALNSLPIIVKKLQDKNYKFSSVGELLKDKYNLA